MDENGTSKDLAAEGKKDERVRRQPVRIHELLGIPKSTGKSTNGNASMRQSQWSQPVLVKDLFKSTSSCKKPHPSERRMTVANGKATNARRQLYGTSVRATPENAFATNAGRPESSETIAAGLHGNAGSQAETRSVQLGVSKSEGKHFVNGPGFRQPERVKDLMESWEKSQTVKREARKSVMGDLRATSVRRKLYVAPSPGGAPHLGRKSLAPSRQQQNQRKDATSIQRKSAKPDKKSSQTQPRRSCLLPPNSIRDKHINRQQSDTIKEESPASLQIESSKEAPEISKKSPPHIESLSLEEQIEIEEGAEPTKNPPSVDPEARSASSDEKIDESAPRRPTVIIAASSNRKTSPDKNSAQSPRSIDDKKSPFALSRKPFRELDRSSFPRHRLDAATSSIDDLLGSSRPLVCESSIGNLPFNSFLEQPPTSESISRLGVDKQTVHWMRGNLELAIQSTEESLFTLKKILRALDELDDNSEVATLPNSDVEIRCASPKIEERKSEKIGAPELPAIVVERCSDPERLDEDFGRLATEPADEENKENVFVEEFETRIERSGRRRSARLAALAVVASPKSSEDSFSAIERELNIVHEKAKEATPRVATPRERRKIDPRSRRSMREYMALKSMVNCLQTPDVKGAPTPKGLTGDISNQIRAKRCISRTLMNELDDLYADSPQ